MATLTLNQQQTQNVNLLNQRLSDFLTQNEVIEFCKRARISVCCEIIDDDVVESFLEYYGVYLIYNNNSKDFHAHRLNLSRK